MSYAVAYLCLGKSQLDIRDIVFKKIDNNNFFLNFFAC
jgi:hypothetical protein